MLESHVTVIEVGNALKADIERPGLKCREVPIGTRPYRLPAEMDATLTPANANQSLDGVRLAAAALDRCRRLVAGDKVGRKIETAFGEHGRTFSQFLRLAHD